MEVENITAGVCGIAWARAERLRALAMELEALGFVGAAAAKAVWDGATRTYALAIDPSGMTDRVLLRRWIDDDCVPRPGYEWIDDLSGPNEVWVDDFDELADRDGLDRARELAGPFGRDRARDPGRLPGGSRVPPGLATAG